MLIVAGVMLTAGDAAEVIATVTVLLVTADVLAHAALLVICTDTTSLLASVVEVNVEPVAPATAAPFTSHW
jgi:hypothetical protein